MKDLIKYYKRDDLEVVWQPSKCTHSAVCATRLGEVFNPKARPWINLQASDVKSITDTVRSCPSGALSLKGDTQQDATGLSKSENLEDPTVSIKVLKNGPLLVSGKVGITLTDGSEQSRNNPALCRCGASANKPFCDGSHTRAKFEV